MRPASECHLALIQAAHAIRRERAATGQGATLQELVQLSANTENVTQQKAK